MTAFHCKGFKPPPAVWAAASLPSSLSLRPLGLPGFPFAHGARGGQGVEGEPQLRCTSLGGASCSHTRFKSPRPLVRGWGSGSPCRLGPLGASLSPAGWVAVPLFSAPLTPFLFTLGDSEGGFAPAGCFFRGGIEAWAGYGSGAPASVAPRGLFPGLRARAPGGVAGGSGSPSRLGP